MILKLRIGTLSENILETFKRIQNIMMQFPEREILMYTVIGDSEYPNVRGPFAPIIHDSLINMCAARRNQSKSDSSLDIRDVGMKGSSKDDVTPAAGVANRWLCFGDSNLGRHGG
jgi:hypothetical protein